MQRRLPDGYQTRPQNEQFLDTPTSIVHQHQLYDFARYLVDRGAVRRIIDIGCGSAEKLAGLDEIVAVDCFDIRAMKDLVAQNVPRARFFEADMEQGVDVDLATLDGSLLICSDVLEHLAQPEVLLKQLAQFSRRCAFVLISTPDRARARGLLDPGPPANPAHTMEWTSDELGRFMLDCGFTPNFLLGYTFNNDLDLAKNTILAICGSEATYQKADRVSVAAVVPVYNEEDIIEQVAHHLHGQGVVVHAIDNWSTDSSYEILSRLVDEGICAEVKRFPDKPPEDYDWSGILDFISDYAQRLDYDWVVFHDADEIRWAPWRDVTLQDAISFVDSVGYNAADFTVLNFGYTTVEPRPLTEFKFFDFARHPGHLVQIKAWRNDKKVVLSQSGGHVAEFGNRRTFPIKFLTQHFPLRSQQQAARKLFRDRLPRLQRERRERGWHNHYDVYEQLGESRPWRPYELMNFHRPVFDAEFLVERVSGIGISTESRAIPNINTRFTADSVAERRLNRLRFQLDALKSSTSWKVTAPLRTIMQFVFHRRSK